jgi:[CysO sulfur-carrier protein]-S-L-cysteine hydrolase
VQVPRSLLDELIEHALADSPNECCGLIGGRKGVAKTLYRARNAEESPLRYSIAPGEQLAIMDRIDRAGEELVGIYHSHTKTEAYPSQTDINLAAGWPDPVYFIVSLADPERPVVRGFTIRDREVSDVDLQIG